MGVSHYTDNLHPKFIKNLLSFDDFLKPHLTHSGASGHFVSYRFTDPGYLPKGGVERKICGDLEGVGMPAQTHPFP